MSTKEARWESIDHMSDERKQLLLNALVGRVGYTHTSNCCSVYAYRIDSDVHTRTTRVYTNFSLSSALSDMLASIAGEKDLVKMIFAGETAVCCINTIDIVEFI